MNYKQNYYHKKDIFEIMDIFKEKYREDI